MYYLFCERKFSQAVTKLSLDCNVWHLAVTRHVQRSERGVCRSALVGAHSAHLDRGEDFPSPVRSLERGLARFLPAPL